MKGQKKVFFSSENYIYDENHHFNATDMRKLYFIQLKHLKKTTGISCSNGLQICSERNISTNIYSAIV